MREFAVTKTKNSLNQFNSAPSVGFVLGDEGPSCYLRLEAPCKELQARGANVYEARAYADFERADVLVFQRPPPRRLAIDEIFRWQDAGKKIVVDFDDDFFHLEPHNIASRAYTPDVLDSLRELVRRADALTVATRKLAEVYGEFNQRIRVFPNALPDRAFTMTPALADSVTVGWQGSHSHAEDLRILRGPLHSLARKHVFKAVLAGYAPKGLIRGASLRPWVKFSEDLEYFRSFADFSIGLCPLRKTAFNEAKSDLKWLEYSALGIPTVASRLAPYSDIEHGVTGFVCRNSSDWEKYVGELLSSAALRGQIGGTARAYVRKERSLSGSLDRWRALFLEIGSATISSTRR